MTHTRFNISRFVNTRMMLGFLVLLLIAVWFGAMPGRVYAQDPDFNSINDPLNGDYELFNVDDLLVMRTKPLSSSTQSQVNNYILETANDNISSQAKRTVSTRDCYMNGYRQPQVTRVGRFFDLPYDLMVTLEPTAHAQGADCTAPGGQPNMGFHVDSLSSGTTLFGEEFVMSAENTAMAMDDFNQDGFDDLLIFSGSGVFAASANVVTDTSQGMTLFATTAFTAAGMAPRTDPTTGDFNGDGLVDTAWAAYDKTVHFATVCPDDIADTVCEGAAAFTVILDPLQSREKTINMPVELTGCTYGNGPWGVGIAGGDYASDGSDGLVTTSIAKGTGDCSLYAYWWEFNADFSLVDGKAISSVTLNTNAPLDVYATSASLDWFGRGDQAVIGVGHYVLDNDCQSGHVLIKVLAVVLTFSGGTMTNHHQELGAYDSCVGWNSSVQIPVLNGMAVGHFAAVPDKPNPDTDYTQRIALLNNYYGVIFNLGVDPSNNYKFTLINTPVVDSSLGLNYRSSPAGTNQTNWLVAGDLQGRGMRLGAPNIVRITNHSEPTIILGHPPMHADYILPNQTTSTISDVVNFSVVPDSFYSLYDTKLTNTEQSSNMHTTSNSYGFKESASEKFKLNVPLVSMIQGNLTQSWQQKFTSTTTNNDYSYSSQEFDSSTRTGFGDQIWINEYDFSIYYYPVIGQTVCPNDKPGCSASEEEPLYVQFSGPSNTQSSSVSGPRLEWYQPLHEPGQIFSYPASYALLEKRYSGLIPLSGTSPTGFYTDDSPNTESANWSGQSGSSVSTGTSRTHSFESDNSITVGPPKLLDVKGPGLQVSGSFDYNNSNATSTLNTSSTSVGSSTGIGIAKPGTFPTPGLYEYRIQPFIFGAHNPVGTVQTIPVTGTVGTTGPIRAAFAANPLAQASGTWWQTSPYAEYIDVALNHPQRWAKTSQSSDSGLNCIDANNCVSFNEPQPDDLWNSEFYMMRGLLVTVDGATGPQRATASVGDDVYLQARVYNYSLQDMPDGSQVHVRFYRQQIVNTKPTSDSELIAETTLDPLTGFASAVSQNVENWAVAVAPFTLTDDMADKYYLFWVVVWAEDSNNQLIQDLPEHGLTEIPQTLTAIGDVPLEPYSNNAGYLHMPFYVQPTPTTVQADAATSTSAGALGIENFLVTRTEPLESHIALGERLLLAADVTSAGGATDGAVVYFSVSDGQNVSVYDVEIIPHIRNGDGFRVSIPFRAENCGNQEIGIEVNGANGVRTEETIDIEVACPPIYMPVINKQ